jgi:hypothetical protein
VLLPGSAPTVEGELAAAKMETTMENFMVALKWGARLCEHSFKLPRSEIEIYLCLEYSLRIQNANTLTMVRLRSLRKLGHTIFQSKRNSNGEPDIF